MAKRKWKRWVDAFGKYNLTELVDIARKQGMLCIQGFKVSMCVHYQIGLYGTSEQMAATETKWAKAKQEFTNRQPGHAFNININIPREQWVDKQPKNGYWNKKGGVPMD